MKAAVRCTPPWSTANFLDDCTGCGRCVSACPQSLLTLNSARPNVDFERGECTFCRACVDACPEPVFDLDPGSAPWGLKAIIAPHCLSRQQVYCRTCADECEARAIEFLWQQGTGGVARVDSEQCTGCGACVRGCPAKAISIALPDSEVEVPA